MKKTYKSPTIQVVKIQSARFIADSTMNMRGNYNSNNVTIGARQSGNSGWDDDYEDD